MFLFSSRNSAASALNPGKWYVPDGSAFLNASGLLTRRCQPEFMSTIARSGMCP